MHMVFRDHTISDMIGFVYSGMPPADAARHLIGNIKEAAKPVLAQGRDAVVSIILDGENAWEYYPKSGREFLRRFYDGLQKESGLEAVTISEAIARHRDFGRLSSLVLDHGLMRTSTSGSAPPRTIVPGIICTMLASSTPKMPPTSPRRNANWLSRRYSSPRQRLELVVRAGAPFRQRS